MVLEEERSLNFDSGSTGIKTTVRLNTLDERVLVVEVLYTMVLDEIVGSLHLSTTGVGDIVFLGENNDGVSSQSDIRCWGSWSSDSERISASQLFLEERFSAHGVPEEEELSNVVLVETGGGDLDFGVSASRTASRLQADDLESRLD